MNAQNLKPYKFRFEYKTDYLCAQVSGDKDSLEISRQYWREIADECKRTKCKKLLIVEDI